MALRSVEQYKQSLRDDREVYYHGERVADVTTHPVIGVAVDHAAIDYELAEDPATRDLVTYLDPADGQRYSTLFRMPQTSDDLLARLAIIEEATQRGRTLVTLVKEIGNDCLFALQLVAKEMDAKLGTGYAARVQAIYRHCRDNDLAMAVAQTDVKGDRSGGPLQQDHPDYYVRMVEERPDGIVVRGAKAHTSVAPNVNELFVIPTRQLTEADRDYAVAFCIPVDTPGLRLVCSGYGPPRGSAFDHPISARHKMMETLTIFDDGFVPNERVFMKGEWQFAGPLARTFVEFHRFTAISYKLPLVDLLCGAAHLIAEYNGIDRAGHVRDKLTWLITYAETLRALTVQAARQGRLDPGGLFVPDPLLVNMAKLHFAENLHKAMGYVQDLSGGLLVTGPSEADLEHPVTGPAIRRYLGGRAVSAGDRLKLLNLISDLTSGDFGGYQAVLAIHAEGSIEAEKITILRSYDSQRTKAYAKWSAGIE